MTGHLSWFATVALSGVILRTAGAVAADITIRPSPETTLITEPLDDDGYVDFVAAINHEWSEGVTPENNAAVLIWTALGAERLPETHREEFFRLLGIEPPTRSPQSFLPLDEFRTQRPTEENRGAESLTEVYRRCRSQPWTSAEYPLLAEWVERNARTLELLHQASSRDRFYTPAVREAHSPLLADCDLYTEQHLRELGVLLACHATLKVGESDIAAAIADLRAIRRFARLLGQGWTTVHVPLSSAMDNYALMMVPSLLQCETLSAQDIRRLQAEFAALDFRLDLSRIVRAEQFTWIDEFQWWTRGVSSSGPVDWWRLAGMRLFMDMNELARAFNPAFEALSPALDEDTPIRRELALVIPLAVIEIERERMWRLRTISQLGWRTAAGRYWGLKRATGWADMIGEIALPLDFHAVRAEMVPVCFALELYRRRQGSYPESLKQLTPDLIREIPADRYSNLLEPIRYLRVAADFRLYSIGPNGHDDDGEFRSSEAEIRELSDTPDDVILETNGFRGLELPPPPPTRQRSSGSDP